MSDDAAYAEALRAMYWRPPSTLLVLFLLFDNVETVPHPALPSYAARYGGGFRIMVAQEITLHEYLQIMGLTPDQPHDGCAHTDSCRTRGVAHIVCDGSCEEWPR